MPYNPDQQLNTGSYLVDQHGSPLSSSSSMSLVDTKAFEGGGDMGWTSFSGGMGGILGPGGAGQLNIGLSRFRSTSEFVGAYVSDDTLHACVQLRAEALAGLKWQLKHVHTGKVIEDGDLNPDFGGGAWDSVYFKLWQALTRLLRQPNPFQTWNDFIQMQSSYYDLTGNAITFKDNIDPRGRPEFMWPLNPSWVQPIVDPEEGLTEYVYMAGSQMLRLNREEASHIKKTNPGTLFWGLSEIAALAGVLDAQVGIDEYQRAFFANGAVLSGVVKAPDNVDAKQYKLLKHELKENFQGIRNHWRVALLTGGMEWQNVSLSQTDMGMKDWKLLGADRIRMVYRVPKSKLGSQDDGQYNKLDAADRTFYKEAIGPLAGVFERAINEDIAHLFGFEFSFVIPQFEDVNEKADIAVKVDGLSCLSVSEKRQSIKKLMGEHIILEENTDLKALASSVGGNPLARLLMGSMANNTPQLPSGD